MCQANLPEVVKKHQSISGYIPKVKGPAVTTQAAAPTVEPIVPLADAPIRKVSRRNRLGIGGGSGSGLSVPL